MDQTLLRTAKNRQTANLRSGDAKRHLVGQQGQGRSPAYPVLRLFSPWKKVTWDGAVFMATEDGEAEAV